MITVESIVASVGGAVDEPVFSFMGLSTDQKPTVTFMEKKIGNGSSFFEMDTQAVKFYDAASDTWV